MIKPNRDFRDLLSELNAVDAEYLVVGAHALAVHGHVRATKDLDVWIRCDKKNAEKVHDALLKFGAPLSELTTNDLATPGVVFQIGVPPVRIDILNQIDGVVFEDAWPSRVETSYDDQKIHVIGREDLIKNKNASGRLQDLADVESLVRLSG